MTRVQLIGPAGNSRETLFAKSGTDGSNPSPSSEESVANLTSSIKVLESAARIDLNRLAVADA
jgi:hypothetical protein